MSNIVEILETLHDKQGLTDGKIAEAVGVSREHIFRLRHGKKKASTELTEELDKYLANLTGETSIETTEGIDPTENKNTPEYRSKTAQIMIEILHDDMQCSYEDIAYNLETSTEYILQLADGKAVPTTTSIAVLEEYLQFIYDNSGYAEDDVEDTEDTEEEYVESTSSNVPFIGIIAVVLIGVIVVALIKSGKTPFMRKAPEMQQTPNPKGTTTEEHTPEKER